MGTSSRVSQLHHSCLVVWVGRGNATPDCPVGSRVEATKNVHEECKSQEEAGAVKAICWRGAG